MSKAKVYYRIPVLRVIVIAIWLAAFYGSCWLLWTVLSKLSGCK